MLRSLLMSALIGAAAPHVAVSPSAPSEQVAVFSGGCFWGIQAVFQHVKGVTNAVSGYAGGDASTAKYDRVSSGNTGHAESVRVTFDPSVACDVQWLQVFFSVAHDPTQLNYQGPDHGPQYRSAIWYANDQQKTAADSYISQLTKARIWKGAIVTQVSALGTFYPAESYHQDYAAIHPNDPYIRINDAPKVAQLRKQLPSLYRDTPVLVSDAQKKETKMREYTKPTDAELKKKLTP